MIRRRGFPLVGLAAASVVALAVPTGARPSAAPGAPTISVSPDPPVPDQPFVLTAHPNGVVGEASYSWSLDGSRTCVTPPSPSPDITLTRPRGAIHVVSCVTGAGGTLTGRRTLIVGPTPAFTADWPRVYEFSFVLGGLYLPLQWNVPARARYAVTYTPSSDTPGRRRRIPLRARVVNTGALTVLQIAPPPGGTPVPLHPRVHRGVVDLRWDLAPDPLYRRAAVRGHRTFTLLRVNDGGVAPVFFGGAKNPHLSFAATMSGHAVKIAIGAGAARGQTVTLRLVNADRPPYRISRRVKLSSARTGVLWPVPDAVWSSGFAAVNLRAHFRRNGVLYSNLAPGGGQWRYLLWRP